VESLSDDIRISQYADLNYAAKHLSHDKWYWLDPVAGGRSGYLVFLPNQPIVWIDEQLKQSYKIQIRVATQVFQKKSVLLASLNKSDGLLRLEDAWLMDGAPLKGSPFTQRWEAVLRFFSEKYVIDWKLQQGLRVELAQYKPLHSALQWGEVPVMMLAQGERAPRRFRVQFSKPEEVVVQQRTMGTNQNLRPSEPSKAKFVPRPRPSVKPMFVDDDEPCPEPGPGPGPGPAGQAMALPHEEFPDTYTIFIQGVKKGYAAVQDLELSRQLRDAFAATAEAAAGKQLPVKVEWNDEFNMYEILGTH